jgi:hypothetical protein|tara:strand:+ start:28 stop:198 length:171 start_codon:yes stop_codon:yes gene_type:complete
VSPEGVTGFGLKDLDWVFGVWLLLVILWNFGYPGANPISDVLVALGLFFLTKFLKT